MHSRQLPLPTVNVVRRALIPNGAASVVSARSGSRISTNACAESGTYRRSYRTTRFAMLKIQATILLSVLLTDSGRNIRAEVPPVAQLNAGTTSIDSGRAVAFYEPYAFLGAPEAYREGTVTGAVDVFRREGREWIHWQTLRPEDGASSARFGQALASDAGRLLVGAPFDRATGAVYSYRIEDGFWVEEQRIAPPSKGLQAFGASVSIHNETALIGAPLTNHSGVGHAGVAYFLQLQGRRWSVVQKLMPQPLGWGQFGFAVAIRDSRCLVGAPYSGAFGVGAVHAFTKNRGVWTHGQRFSLNDEDKHFGWALAIDEDGDHAVVGAPGESAGTVGGSVHFFEWAGVWRETAKFELEQPAGFGRSVDMSGGLVVVGAPWDHDPLLLAGSSYTYRKVGAQWVEQRRLGALEPEQEDYFGASVATDGSLVVIGAPRGSGRAPGTGRAFVFSSDRCVDGSVGGGIGRVSRTLLVNGSAGDGYSTVSLSTSDPIELTMLASPSGPFPGGFVLYASAGEIDRTQVTPQPRDIGTMCFRAPLVGGGNLKAIWNNLGRESRLGTPTRESHPAPSLIEYIPGGAGRPYVATLQGMIMDNASVSDLGASVTNAIVLKVE